MRSTDKLIGAAARIPAFAEMTTTALGILCAAYLLTVATTQAHAEDAHVTIDNFTFSPHDLKVKAGTKVTWVNHDDIPHTVADPPTFRSRALDTDESFSFTFTTPGTYSYFCALHPHMTGTIVVEAASSATK
jgi:plastocyanin